MNLIREHVNDLAAVRAIRAALPIAEKGGRDVVESSDGPGSYSQTDYLAGMLEALYEAGMLVESGRIQVDVRDVSATQLDDWLRLADSSHRVNVMLCEIARAEMIRRARS